MGTSMFILTPYYSLSMAYFCNMCGISSSATFSAMEDQTYSVACIRDNIYNVLEGIVLTWCNAFIASLLGHILMNFGLLLSQPSEGDMVDSSSKIIHGWGIVAFVVLIADCLLQMYLSTAAGQILQYFDKPDDDASTVIFSESIDDDGPNYSSCDATIVTQLSTLRQGTLGYTYFILGVRCVVDFIVAYALYRRIKRDDSEEKKEKEKGKEKEDETKAPDISKAASPVTEEKNQRKGFDLI